MIQSAKVIGAGISYQTYSAQAPDSKRGHKDFIMSRSELTNFASNPKRWLDGYKADDDGETTATIFGSLVECLAGLNGKFDELYAVAPAEYEDEKTGKMKPWNWNATVCKEWRDGQGEVEIIKAELYGKAKLAVDALHAEPDVSELFRHSQKQVMVSGIWVDEQTKLEIPIRCLIDLVPDKDHSIYGKDLADFKTARNGNPAIWAKVVSDSGYDVQAALSTDLYTAATSEDRLGWVWPVQENVHPYHVVTPMPAMTEEFRKWGRAKYEHALKFYAQCLATNTWPSYSTGDRLVFGPCQFIDPKTVWEYRESWGGMAYQLPEKKPALAAEEPVDVPIP